MCPRFGLLQSTLLWGKISCNIPLGKACFACVKLPPSIPINLHCTFDRAPRPLHGAMALISSILLGEPRVEPELSGLIPWQHDLLRTHPPPPPTHSLHVFFCFFNFSSGGKCFFFGVLSFLFLAYTYYKCYKNSCVHMRIFNFDLLTMRVSKWRIL
jgi:hypothetical protein